MLLSSFCKTITYLKWVGFLMDIRVNRCGENLLERWESDAIQTFTHYHPNSEEEAIIRLENMLGKVAKKHFQIWKSEHREDFEQLKAVALNVKNLTSQIKTIFLGSDPYRFQTNLVDSAYIDLVNLTLSTNGSLTG